MTNLKEIIVEFTIPKGNKFPIISYLIRLLQWRVFSGQKWSEVPSHSRVRFFDKKHDLWWVYEASGLKVKLIGFETAIKKTKTIAEYKLYVSD